MILLAHYRYAVEPAVTQEASIGTQHDLDLNCLFLSSAPLLFLLSCPFAVHTVRPFFILYQPLPSCPSSPIHPPHSSSPLAFSCDLRARRQFLDRAPLRLIYVATAHHRLSLHLSLSSRTPPLRTLKCTLPSLLYLPSVFDDSHLQPFEPICISRNNHCPAVFLHTTSRSSGCHPTT